MVFFYCQQSAAHLRNAVVPQSTGNSGVRRFVIEVRMGKKKYVENLDNLCVECGKERTTNEYGYCSNCFENPVKTYDVSPIIVHPFGYAEKNRPKWHKSVQF